MEDIQLGRDISLAETDTKRIFNCKSEKVRDPNASQTAWLSEQNLLAQWFSVISHHYSKETAGSLGGALRIR